jgi:hypothetical protein
MTEQNPLSEDYLKELRLPHPDDLPPAALDYISGLTIQDPRDAIAELKSDMRWSEITGGSEDPRMLKLLGRPLPAEKFTSAQKAAYLLSRLRLF